MSEGADHQVRHVDVEITRKRIPNELARLNGKKRRRANGKKVASLFGMIELPPIGGPS